MRVSAVIAGLALCAAGCAGEVGDDDDGEELDSPEVSEADLAAASNHVNFGNIPVWVHFANPVNATGEDRTVVNEVIRLLDDTPAGATVRGNIFSISISAVVDAFARAKARGVKFQITHSGHDAVSPAAKKLDAALGNEHKFCDGACISSADDSIAHIKFFTFTKTKDPNGVMRSDVSWWGSANQTWASGVKLSNNAFTVYGDEAIADAFVRHANLMWTQRHFSGNDYYDADAKRGYVHSGATKTSLYMSPEAQLDLWDSRLNDIVPDANCRVRVLHASIRDSRMAVVNRLVALKRGGCKVWIAAETVEPKARAALHAARIPIKQQKIHDKVVLHYSRMDGGSAYRYFVLSGSHNLSGSALRKYDELLTRTESKDLYNAFFRHFNDAYNTGSPL
jgi:hypothetical protein